MSRVIVLWTNEHRRSNHLARLAATGMVRLGYRPIVRPEKMYEGKPLGDAAMFYGLTGNLPKIFADYRRCGREVVFLDLGYFGREDPRGSVDGNYRVSINDKHPWRYMMGLPAKGDRSRGLKLVATTRSINKDGCILLVGMSAKSANVYGLKPEQWERDIIDRIRKITDRPIYYRPKPSWDDKRPLPNTRWADPNSPIQQWLDRAFAVVTHHSNTAAEALMLGIPSYSEEGAACAISGMDLSTLTSPVMIPVKDRQRWLDSLAYCQWHSLKEIQTGEMWRWYRDEARMLP